MRRIIAAALTAILLAGCSSHQNSRQPGTAEKEDSSEQLQNGGLSETAKYEASQPLTDPADATAIEICSYSREEVIDLLNRPDNLAVSGDLVLNIPDRAPILAFRTKTLDNIYDIPQDFDALYSAFQEMYAYYFPERSLDENHLYYVGRDSDEDWDENDLLISSLHKVKDDLDTLRANQHGAVWLDYDEGYGKDDKNGCLEFNFGQDPEKSGVGTMDRRSIDWSEARLAAILPPSSGQSFRLADKETTIAEAVRFFEDKIRRAPCPKERNCTVKAAAVKVLALDNGCYGYQLLCAKEIGGISMEFSYGDTTETALSKYETIHNEQCFMVKSDEIESFQACNPYLIMENVRQFDSIVPFDAAVSLISSKLTAEVQFEVQRAELVYCQQPVKTAEGYLDIYGYPADVTPVWKLTLFNPNDQLTYACYVSADGTDFNYSVFTF